MVTFEAVHEVFQGFCDADPTYGAQLAVHVGGERVLDLVHGPDMGPDSLVPVYSSSKGATAVVVALLVQREQLDLDERVATYWPEFAARGKGAVTVRQMLSHQAGLLGVDGGFTWEELLDHAPLAERLAAQRPFWQPGQAFSYHPLTIGTLADELVRRIDGRSVAEVLRQEVTGPRGIDVWMGTPASEDHRVVTAEPPTRDEVAAFLASPEGAGSAIGVGGTGGGVGPHSDGLAALSKPEGVLEPSPVNDVGFRRVGPPAVGALASGRGLAALYASLRHEVGGQPRVLTDDTIGQMVQIQVAGTQLASGNEARFGVLFEVPCPPRWPFGQVGAFGHDGAGGSLAFCDPAFDVAFGYTLRRQALPRGMDRRALELARAVRHALH
jgi:CubicO group peptidase (beta-lactamase class C family)